MRMYRIVMFVCLIVFGLTVHTSVARDRTLTAEEKAQLKHAKTILIQTLALTERGDANTKDIQQVVSQRLQALGFSTHENSHDAHDVIVRVKCEERKTGLGPSRYGGDADSAHAPSRNWKGPACQITYGLDGHDIAWQKEIRTEFNNARRAARAARIKDSGQYALDELAKILQQDDFPYLLTAEWDQAHRLSLIMKKPETPLALKLKIIPLLGSMTDHEALVTLERALHDPGLASSAAIAIGHQGDKATALLLKILTTSKDTNLKASAAKGLGEIATHNSQAPVFTPFVTTLQEPATELPVQTEIVLALGKLADQRAVDPLKELSQKAWTNPSQDPEMQKLREAVSWSLWQLNPDAHSGE